MPTKTKERSQISMDDTFLKDPELEALLEKRQELKQGVADYRKADKDAKAKLATVTQVTPYRIGRFVIAKSEHQAHEVAFEVGVTSSISIKLATE